MANATKTMIAEPIPWNATSDSIFWPAGVAKRAPALYRSAHPLLRLKQQQLSSKDGNGTC
jgi:hypothetical protein